MDKRKWAIAHRVDPDVDGDWAFIGGSLLATHLVATIGYMLPSDAVLQAATAAGGSYHSDGRMLLLMFQ